MKFKISCMIIILPLLLMLAHCSNFNQDSIDHLLQSDSRILILINSSDVREKNNSISQVIQLHDSKNSLKNIIDIKTIDGRSPNNFNDLITDTNSGLLELLFSSTFNYDRIYFVDYTLSTISYIFDRGSKPPEGINFEDGAPPGYIIQPFTLNGPNDYYRFSAKSSKELFKLIISHTIEPEFSYEAIDKTNIERDMKLSLEHHFGSSEIYWSKFPQLLKQSEILINYDDNITDYLISNFTNSLTKPYSIDDLNYFKTTIIDVVEDLSKYNKMLKWLDDSVKQRQDEISVEIEGRNFPQLKIYSNLEGDYQDSLLVNVTKVRDDLYKHLVIENWSYITPQSISVEQLYDQSLSINLAIKLNVNEYHTIEDKFSEKTGKMFLIFPDWIINKLKTHIIYDGYVNRYSLTIKKEESPETITIYGYTDRTDRDLFKKIIIAAGNGNEYLHDILLKQYNIQYDSSILYENTTTGTRITVNECLSTHSYGWLTIKIEDKLRTMTGNPTKDFYLHSFFNIP